MERVLYQKNNSINNFNFVMAYPSKEEFALSSLGYMWLYKTVQESGLANTERIYTDNPNFRFKNTNAVAFSLSFDFDFMGVFEILEKNHIEFFSEDRDENSPLIFAGGPVLTTNPEPYKNIFDFMIIGDGEILITDVLKVLISKHSREEILKRLADIDGIYVPDISKKVIKRTEPLQNVIYTPIISDKSYFKDTFIIELQRGCMNRCAFCTASYLNLPFRSYPYEQIISAIDLGLKYTDKIALLGAQISAHPDFSKIIEYIGDKLENGIDIELGISSLRVDAVTSELIKTLVKGGQKTSTIAIEAASEKLRKFINKNLKEEQILNAIKICRENGLKGLKIYCMIGIPFETNSDIEEFINLAAKIKKENKGFNITFSFSSFVPKPQTPFERLPRESTTTLEKKRKFLEKELAKLGFSSKFSGIKWDYWQTVLSRGDSSLGKFLAKVYEYGGGNSAYKRSLKELKPDISHAIEGFDENAVLPWDFIENYTQKEILKKEYRRLEKYLHSV